jgi:hypothetical protein
MIFGEVLDVMPARKPVCAVPAGNRHRTPMF